MLGGAAVDHRLDVAGAGLLRVQEYAHGGSRDRVGVLVRGGRRRRLDGGGGGHRVGRRVFGGRRRKGEHGVRAGAGVLLVLRLRRDGGGLFAGGGRGRGCPAERTAPAVAERVDVRRLMLALRRRDRRVQPRYRAGVVEWGWTAGISRRCC